MVAIREILNAYKEANEVSRAEMARSIGVPERRLRGIMAEGRTARPEDAKKITEWLKEERFDYVPPFAEEPPKKASKKKSKKASDTAEGVSVRGDAKVLVQMYRETAGLKYDADAASVLIKKGFKTVMKEGL